MAIEAITNQEINTKISKMLSYQRDTPLHVRIITPKIHDVEIMTGHTLYSILQKVVGDRDVQITLIINPNWMLKDEEKELLEKFKKLRIKIHANTNLHAKMILVENPSEKIALVGSANWTKSGFNGNDEASIYLINQDSHVYDKLSVYVTRMLKRINEYIAGSDTTARKDHIEKEIKKFEGKIEKLKQELGI